MTLLLAGRMEIGDIDVMELQTSMAGALFATAFIGPHIWHTALFTLPGADYAIGMKDLIRAFSGCGMLASLARNFVSVLKARRATAVPDPQLGRQVRAGGCGGAAARSAGRYSVERVAFRSTCWGGG